MAYPDADVIRWWMPPLLKNVVSHELDEAAKPFAEELATTLTAGGLPARAVASSREAREGTAAMDVLISALELSHWDFSELAKNSELRGLAARGMKEALRAVDSTLMLPVPLISNGLRIASVAPQTFRAMWRVHGPKIAAQTRSHLDTLIGRARERGLEPSSLKELRQRIDLV
jgi:hypothetical protein